MKTEKKTLVLGASPNESRYSNMAVRRLREAGHPVVAVGLREGTIADVSIQQGLPALEGIHTVTLYVGPDHQPAYYDYLMALRPQRIVFNPGTENTELLRLARENGIETEIGCTLVMLTARTY